jgi:hypothetical protein
MGTQHVSSQSAFTRLDVPSALDDGGRMVSDPIFSFSCCREGARRAWRCHRRARQAHSHLAQGDISPSSRLKALGELSSADARRFKADWASLSTAPWDKPAARASTAPQRLRPSQREDVFGEKQERAWGHVSPAHRTRRPDIFSLGDTGSRTSEQSATSTASTTNSYKARMRAGRRSTAQLHSMLTESSHLWRKSTGKPIEILPPRPAPPEPTKVAAPEIARVAGWQSGVISRVLLAEPAAFLSSQRQRAEAPRSATRGIDPTTYQHGAAPLRDPQRCARRSSLHVVSRRG